MAYQSSGNAVVDQMGGIAISGNIVPQEWYKSIVKENGKPHLLAITILADIVYWYRPSEERDERTGEVIGWRKKFKGDILQKSYQQYANLYGESKRVVKAAMDLLEKNGVIKRHFMNVSLGEGSLICNQMFISLDPNVLISMTHKVKESEERISIGNLYEGLPKNVRDGTEKRGEVVQKTVGGGTEKCRDMVQKIVEGSTENCNGMVPENVGCLTENCAYTNNTTENTNTEYYTSFIPQEADLQEEGGKTIGYLKVLQDMERRGHRKIGTAERSIDNRFVSEAEEVISIVKDNIAYDEHMKDPDEDLRSRYEELFNVIKDTLIGQAEIIRIGETNYPYEVVKRRMLELNESHLCQVRDSIIRYPGEIHNMRKFMLASLFNAPAILGTYYRQRVFRDFYTDDAN